MKILTKNEQEKMTRCLADMAEAFVKVCAFVPTNEFPPLCETIMEGLADVANGIGGIKAMEVVSKRIRANCTMIDHTRRYPGEKS